MLAAIVVTATATAQSPTGFPLLPPVPQTGQLRNKPTATHFRFIAAGDNRPGYSDAPQPGILSRILSDARKFKPAFFFWAGDIVYGHDVDREKLGKQYHAFFDVARLAKAPVFNAPGNHEMDTVTQQGSVTTETGDPQLQAYYLENLKFPAKAPPFGAFDYGNSRFIALDTEEIEPAPAPKPPRAAIETSEGKTILLDPGFVSQLQMDLLAQDLEANKAKAHIFVFMHHPIMPVRSRSALNLANSDALQALFKQYPNVSYVVAAHEHLYFNATGTTLTPAEREDPSAAGPSYVVTGGAGAPLDTCPDTTDVRCGSFNHYLMFEVTGKKVKVEVVKASTNNRNKED
jgi:Calcineurin-like phosphoesterase